MKIKVKMKKKELKMTIKLDMKKTTKWLGKKLLILLVSVSLIGTLTDKIHLNKWTIFSSYTQNKTL